jgi:peptidoglycan-associated lipoprotein
MIKSAVWMVVMMSVLAAACGGKKPPVAKPTTPADIGSPSTAARPPAPPEPVPEPATVPPEPLRDDAIRSGNIDELNRNSPLKPVFYDYDSAELSPAGKTALDENAGLLKKYAAWTITIEGHCDERGTPEYNLALGERRAVAARTYLVSLGIAADRLRTVSYGKEFPFDPGHDEPAWQKNRRAHFVITAAK